MNTIIASAVIVFFEWNIVWATTYYFSSYGKTTNSGKSYTCPLPISKLSFLNVVAGDSVLFKRGDTFSGSIRVLKSGTQEKQIVYSAYGEGFPPIFDGSKGISKWTAQTPGSDIYWALCDFNVNQLFQDGKPMTLARFPKKGYIKICGGGKNNIVIDTKGLGGNYVDWTGASVHIKRERFILDSRIVAQYAPFVNDSSKIQITLGKIGTKGNNDLNDSVGVGWGLFFNNKREALNSPGEWYYDKNNNRLYVFTFSGDDPNSHLIQASYRDWGVGFKCLNQSNIRLEKINFKYQDWTAVQLINCSNISVIQIQVDYPGYNGIDFWGTRLYATNNVIRGACLIGISLIYPSDHSTYCTHSQIVTNSIIGSGLVTRLGRDGYFVDNGDVGMGMHIRGDSNSISGNIIDSSAYNGIKFSGLRTIVEKNLIRHFCCDLDDGGGIYSHGNSSSGSIIQENQIMYSLGNGEGTENINSTSASGIYLDDYSQGISIVKNLVYNADNGIYIHNSWNNLIINNTIYGNRCSQIWFKRDYLACKIEMNGNIVKDNILFSRSKPGDTIPPFCFTIHLAGGNCYPPATQNHPMADTSGNYVCQEFPEVIACRRQGGNCLFRSHPPSFLAFKHLDSIELFPPLLSGQLLSQKIRLLLVKQLNNFEAKIILKDNPKDSAFLWVNALLSAN